MERPGASGWHRVFHPLCGADPLTLARLVVHAGPPSPAGLPRYAVAMATALARLPFTLAERAAAAVAPPPAAPPPVFILGHMRSGTTHLHNLLAASGAFAVVPPVLAGMPWEARGLGRLVRPLIEPYLPETRIIDRVRVTPESPTEDEVALANFCGLSYFHAVYFPRRFRRDYARGLLLEGASEAEIAARMRALRRWVDTMSAIGGGRPLLLKNPAYTAQIDRLRGLWPEARFVHIHRDPFDLFASTRRMLRTVTRELGLQRVRAAEIDAAILDVYPRMMERLTEETARLPPWRLVHVAYERLDRDPVAEVERIWRGLELPDPSGAREGVARYVAGLGGYEKSLHALSPEDRATVAARWSQAAARIGALSEAAPA